MDKIPYSPACSIRDLHFPVSIHNPAPPPPAYAVFQIGGSSIFGCGHSPDSARSAARRVLPESFDLEALPFFPPANGNLTSGFYMALVTPRLAEFIVARGGCSHVDFTAAGGIFDLSPAIRSSERLDGALRNLISQLTRS